ncbi:hypothetical protein [Brevibacillus sp. Leaf182]|uniref:hypothetical protein n=1 Tax=Brevibacillus sp. Leaf182 TaxID=1736290 RepID=UPI0006FDCEC3|nr:hypothetical protein [Brevibacillus sp. Leaf182]RAT95955.1 hypothetical protein ASG16_019410 [Brevibacillus sp. Leaf182]
MSKINKVVLAGTLALTGIVGFSPNVSATSKVEATTSKVEATTSNVEAASISPQQTSAHAKNGYSATSSKINGAGQYGRINLQIESVDHLTATTARVMKVVAWGADQEVASVQISYVDYDNGIYNKSTDVWLEKGALYYIDLSVENNGSSSAGLSNYTW